MLNVHFIGWNSSEHPLDVSQMQSSYNLFVNDLMTTKWIVVFYNDRSTCYFYDFMVRMLIVTDLLIAIITYETNILNEYSSAIRY